MFYEKYMNTSLYIFITCVHIHTIFALFLCVLLTHVSVSKLILLKLLKALDTRQLKSILLIHLFHKLLGPSQSLTLQSAVPNAGVLIPIAHLEILGIVDWCLSQ